MGLTLVVPLEEDWRRALDAVAHRHRWPASGDVARLAARTIALSAAYNDASVARASLADAGGARLGFAFARDVPKGAGAVRELVASGALGFGARPMRVLDVGAGLGAMTWGLARALEAFGECGVVEATWLDAEGAALELGAEIVRERQGSGVGRSFAEKGVELHVTKVVRSIERPVEALGKLDPFDVVLAGHVLSELDVGVAAEARVERHAALIGTLLERYTSETGALVLVEPALRDRTRHLHRVRDALVARGATVFAPCTHQAPCPALERETDWCHEDLPVDLPGWLVPIARAAGLRHEGLTFSYLVLRKRGAPFAASLAAPPGAGRMRIVSELIRTKGKREVFVCGEMPRADGGEVVAARVRAVRLDRSATEKNTVWADLVRGDVVAVDPPFTVERPRVEPAARVMRSGDTESR